MHENASTPPKHPYSFLHPFTKIGSQKYPLRGDRKNELRDGRYYKKKKLIKRKLCLQQFLFTNACAHARLEYRNSSHLRRALCVRSSHRMNKIGGLSTRQRYCLLLSNISKNSLWPSLESTFRIQFVALLGTALLGTRSSELSR